MSGAITTIKAADARFQHGYIGTVMPAPETRDRTEIRRKRLLFRSWHRGTREADLILGSFAEAHLGAFDASRLDAYEALLECPDADLFDWITGRATPPPEHDHAVTRLLLTFRYDPRAP
jgi:antitoxin CptB